MDFTAEHQGAPGSAAWDAASAHCPRCQVPFAAGSAFCGSCGNALPALAVKPCGGCGAPNPLGLSFCTACGRRAEPRGVAGFDPAPERGPRLSVGWAEVQGLDALADHLPAAEVQSECARIFRGLAERAAAYGGRVDRFLGDGVMAIWGAPVAHDDDAIRAARGALAMQHWFADFSAGLKRAHNVELVLRVGVSTGFPRWLGPEVAGDDTRLRGVMRDPISVAGRLRGVAPPGAVLIDEDTWRFLRGRFEAETAPELALPGQEQPVGVLRVSGELRRPPGAPRYATPLIGRDHEIDRVLASYGVCRNEATQRAVTLRGGDGVGKTRLLHELVDRMSGGMAPAETLWAQADADESRRPLAAMGRLVRYAAGCPGETDARLVRRRVRGWVESAGAGVEAEARAHLLSWLAGHPVERSRHVDPQNDAVVGLLGRAAHALADQLRALTRRGPLLIVAEDLHVWDEASRSILDVVRGLLEDTPLFLVGTVRGDSDRTVADTDHHRLLELGPLASPDARELIDCLLPAGCPESLAVALISASDGNPMFLELCCAEMREEGELTRVPAASLDEAIARAIDRVPEPARSLLLSASAIGRELELDLLVMLSGGQVSKADLKVLADSGLMSWRSDRSEGRLLVRHPSMVAAGRRALPEDSRRQTYEALSEHAAGVLADGYRAAYYASMAGDPTGAANAWVLCGEAALELQDPIDARWCFGSAMALIAEDDTVRAELRHQALLGEAEALAALGERQEAAEKLQEVALRTREAHPAVEARAQARLGRLLQGHEAEVDPEPVVSACERAIALAENLELREVQVEAALNLALLSMARGRPAEAARYLDNARSVAELSDGAEMLRLRGEIWIASATLLTLRGRFREALQAADEAIEVADARRDPDLQMRAGLARASALGELGALAQGVEALRAAITAGEKAGSNIALLRRGGLLGWYARQLGRIDVAERLHEAAIRDAEAAGRERLALRARVDLARDRIEQGELEEGHQLLSEVQARTQEAGAPVWRWRWDLEIERSLAELSLARRDLDDGERRAGRVVQTAIRAGALRYLAIGHRLVAEVAAMRGLDEDALSAAARARAEATAIGCLAELWRSGRLEADLLEEAGRTVAAGEARRIALQARAQLVAMAPPDSELEL